GDRLRAEEGLDPGPLPGDLRPLRLAITSRPRRHDERQPAARQRADPVPALADGVLHPVLRLPHRVPEERLQRLRPEGVPLRDRLARDRKAPRLQPGDPVSGGVLVLGGTGLLGRAMVKLLEERGREFAAPGRADLDLADLGALPARIAAYAPAAIVNLS